MLVLNECRITEDGKYLVVEASVDSLNWYKEVYIKHVIIDTDETWIPSGPSSTPVYQQEFELKDSTVSSLCGQAVTEDNDCKCGNIILPDKQGKKNIRLYLSAKDIGLSSLNSNIFFVYVIASGYPDPMTPCGMDNSTITGVALNLRLIYNAAMGYIKSLGDTCEIPKGFIDIFLKYKALELSLKTGNYPEAFKMWKYLLGIGKSSNIPNKGCRCHGNK